MCSKLGCNWEELNGTSEVENFPVGNRSKCHYHHIPGKGIVEINVTPRVTEEHVTQTDKWSSTPGGWKFYLFLINSCVHTIVEKYHAKKLCRIFILIRGSHWVKLSLVCSSKTHSEHKNSLDWLVLVCRWNCSKFYICPHAIQFKKPYSNLYWLWLQPNRTRRWQQKHTRKNERATAK